MRRAAGAVRLPPHIPRPIPTPHREEEEKEDQAPNQRFVEAPESRRHQAQWQAVRSPSQELAPNAAMNPSRPRLCPAFAGDGACPGVYRHSRDREWKRQAQSCAESARGRRRDGTARGSRVRLKSLLRGIVFGPGPSRPIINWARNI